MAADAGFLSEASSIDSVLQRLRAIPGIGQWTAQYIALRQLREPDAFPATDAALLRSFASLAGRRHSAAQLQERAEKWRPWRAYAAQHIWAARAHSRQHTRDSVGSIPAVAGKPRANETQPRHGPDPP